MPPQKIKLFVKVASGPLCAKTPCTKNNSLVIDFTVLMLLSPRRDSWTCGRPQSRCCCGDRTRQGGGSAQFTAPRSRRRLSQGSLASPKQSGSTYGAPSVVSFMEGDGALQSFVREPGRLLRSAVEVEELDCIYGEVTSYTDHIFANGGHHDLPLCRRMLRTGLAQATLRRAERVGIFTAWKKDSQRSASSFMRAGRSACSVLHILSLCSSSEVSRTLVLFSVTTIILLET